MGSIRRAVEADAGALAGAVAEAFHDLAVCRWLVPDPQERRRVLPDNFRIFVEHGIEHGAVYTTDELDAVAVWFSDAPDGVPEILRYAERVARVCGAHTDRFQLLDEAMHAAHPADPPHEHLAFLAVRTAAQGRGLGSALLELRHEDLDQRGVPAYLEASSPRSRELYLRHGYADSGEPFAPKGGPEPCMWPMWRAPR
ncbi:GNAT family N-acetyltransferase [Rugosimonospora acidiphila]|uniref:GNAT family N-acetyltransferase n=1 Tax=Rugosimonospora acidiphila TaxID=556531 RepID=A0ABP9SP70_9ACTN